MEQKVDLPMLDKLIKDTVKHLEEGTQQIAEFARTAQLEREELQASLQKVKIEALDLIDQVDRMEKEEEEARNRLIEISRDFENYTGEDIVNAYNHARKTQIQLGLLRGQKMQMRIRQQIELSLQRMAEYVERAESLAATVGVAMNFLLSNLLGVGLKIEEMQQRQLLGMHIIRAQEEERKRVAREIHDGPAQSMANLVLRAEICEKMLEKQPEALRQELISLKEMVRSSLQDVRKIIFELRPMMLDDLGIIPALKRYIADFQQKNGVAVEFEAINNHKKWTHLGGTLEIAVFRIIQEALRNVSKHARAAAVIIHLEQADERINLRIKDDGQGFELAQAMDTGKSRSYGLLGMRERVELMKGELKIITKPGAGTDIFVSIPLKKSMGESYRERNPGAAG